MLVRSLIAAAVVAALTFLALAYLRDSSWAVYAIPPIVGLGVVLALRPQLEWRQAQRAPPDLDPVIAQLFARQLPPYYTALDEGERLRFRQRTALVRMATDFKGQGFENVPGDVAALIASQSARLTFRSARSVVLGAFETVVLYRHPFPTPEIPKPWHASELFAEDGVLLFSVEQALPGILQHGRFFNLVLYEWLRAYALAVAPPEVTAQWPGWADAVTRVAGQPPAWVTAWIGLPEPDGPAVVEALFHDFPAAFAKTYPDAAAQLRRRWADALLL